MIFVPDCTVKVEAHPYIPLNICAAEVKFRGRVGSFYNFFLQIINLFFFVDR